MHANRSIVLATAILALVACKRGASAPRSDCQPLADYLVTPAAITLDTANATLVLGHLCEVEQWPAEARQCLRRAADRAAVDACATTGMPADKAARLAGRLDALARGGKDAVAAGRFDDVPGAPGTGAAVPAPPPTCDGLAANRLAAAMGARMQKDFGAGYQGDLETITFQVTLALCKRDAWPPPALACASAAPMEKGALDPCVAMLSAPQQAEWGRQIALAVAGVEAAIKAGSARPGATWDGALAPPAS